MNENLNKNEESFSLRRKVQQLEEGNRKLKENYKQLLNLFSQATGYIHTQGLDENTSRMLTMVEGIRKIDTITKIRDPIEWITQIDAFINMSTRQGGKLEDYVDWLGNLLKSLSMSRRESFCVLWEDTFMKVFANVYEKFDENEDDELERVLTWIGKGQKLLKGIIATFNNLKLIDQAPTTSTRFGKTATTEASLLFCGTEKVLLGDKEEKIRKFKKDLDRLEELESAVRLFGRRNPNKSVKDYLQDKLDFNLDDYSQ